MSASEVCWKYQHDIDPGDLNCVECARLGETTPVRFGRYQVLAYIGHGTFGVVYRCFDPYMGRDVAVKKLDAPFSVTTDSLTEFQSQARVSHHRGIVQIFDTVPEEGYFVMEYVSGGNLQRAIDEQPDEVRRRFVPLALAITEALRAAHVERICHRDIKPENILLAPGWEPKIGDFGIARLISRSQFGRTVAGTPAYAAPEVLGGEDYDLDVDIYSLGTLFYMIWVGELPYKASSIPGLALAKSAGGHTPVHTADKSVATWISTLIDQMLGKPGYRPSTELVHAELEVHGTERRRILTVDDFQREIAFLYGFANQNRSPLLLTMRLLTNLEGVTGALRAQRSEYTTTRIEQYLPKSFAWLCALLISVDTRLSEIISYKFKGKCPYCGAEVCECATRAVRPKSEVNQALLEQFATLGSPADPEPDRPFAYYKDMFRKIYGPVNAKQSVNGVSHHALAAVAHVTDALLHLGSLEHLQRIDVLHLELADLAAWFFALLVLYEDSSTYDFETAFKELYGSGCYVCHAAPCRCQGVERDIHLVNWRHL